MLEWYPPADQINIPLTNFVLGHDTRLAVCLHIMNSSFASCKSWFKSSASGVSAHFGIGKDGSCAQFVSLANSANAQGLHYDGQWYTERQGEGRVNVRPTWARLTPGMNINRHVIAIEHEGKPGEPLTPAMIATQTALLRWIAEQTGLVYVVGRTLIGHSMLDNVNRAYCPGPAFDLAAIAMRANAPAIVDWQARWGRDDYDRVKDFGITTAWRDTYRTGQGFGRALTDEFPVRGGGVGRAFENGYVLWHATGGVEVKPW